MMRLPVRVIRKSESSGFTLLEVLIAIAIAVVSILFFSTTQGTLQINSETAYQRIIAVQDACRLLERMRLTAKTGTFPSNVVAAFPAGTVLGYSSMASSASEFVSLSYANTAADPLDVTLTVSWTGYNGRDSSQTVRTLVTQRS